MNWKKFISVAFISAALVFLIAPVGGYLGHNYKFGVAAICYCILTVVALTKNHGLHRSWVISAIVLPVILIYAPIHVNNFSQTLLSFPSFVAHYLGVLAGLLVFGTRVTRLKIFISGILVLFSFWVGFEGYSFWLNRVNYGTFSGRVSKTVMPFKFYTADGRLISNSDFRSKLVVLDFWNTGCGVCFEKFPKLETASNRFRKNESVSFYSVNIPLKRDSAGYARQVWKDLSYTVPGLFADDPRLQEHFGVRVYPTTLIVKDGINVIYKGTIEGVEKVLEEELEL